MSKQSPLAQVKDHHGSKAKLIANLVSLIDAEDGESKDEHKARLLRVSNAKLLHLLGLGERVKSLGGREAIVAKIAELRGQSKDHEYTDSLKRRSLGVLVDLHDSFARRAAGKSPKKVPRQQRKRNNRCT
jgi:hypothetical protein